MLVKSQVKYIQTLGHKKYRDSEAVFIAEGPKLIGELLDVQQVPLIHLFATGEWMEISGSRVAGKPSTTITEMELKRISFLSTPNQVLAIFGKPVFPQMKLEGKISLVLDNIQDPGNMGTIVRVADWFAIQHIICSADSADVFNPKVVQASMGSIARVQVSYTDLGLFFTEHKDIPAYATVLDGDPVFDIKPIPEGIIVIGNESKGIDKELLKMVQHKITIPRKGFAESLNAGVATGIVLAQLTRNA